MFFYKTNSKKCLKGEIKFSSIENLTCDGSSGDMYGGSLGDAVDQWGLCWPIKNVVAHSNVW